MDSVLSVLAMVAGLLLLGWLVGSGDTQGKRVGPGEAPPAQSLHAPAAPSESDEHGAPEVYVAKPSGSGL